MPELPEVEAARRAIEENCIGRKIKRSLIADDPKVIDGVSRSDFESSLLGKTIVAAHRKGKNMWLQLDSPPFPSFQFGMAGAIYIKGVAVTKYKRSAVSDTDEWPSKYSKLFIELDDGMELSFTDKRRFAKVRLLKNPASMPPISELGPDSLFEPMTIDEFIDSLRKKKIGIKALLLDQSFMSGIGNWIADEVLYQARIHPMQIVSSLPKESCTALHKCIKEVIEKAVEVGADSSQFPSSWIFHSREKKPGKAFVDGKKIEFITAGGRTSAYVPELQKLSGDQAAKAPSKPRKQTVKGSKNEDSDDNDQGSEEEENAAKSVQPKGRRSTTGNGPKMPPAKRKSSRSNKDDEDEDDDDDSSDNDDDDDYGSDHKKIRTAKNPPAKRKSKKASSKKK
ncbi:formamidopyrimidine-DNA glycosylase isoform X1 [Rhododendron vialii]|uniref:formamidopyrimidine-DNA glycosylase isoform X1 n=1 Tax=Rhododendron vialii TaxID=182163 RepID=UPI00265E8E72|nr:formamidopyrimidine-DNA glycosylase isoform X1 [Rhododendron vialii]